MACNGNLIGSPACIKASTDVKVLDGVNDDHKASSSEEESESVEELDVEIAFSEQGSGSGLSLFEEFQDSGKRIVGSLSSSDSLSDLDELDDPEDRTAASVVSILSEYNEFEPLSDGGSDDDLESFSSDSDLEIVSFYVYGVSHFVLSTSGITNSRLRNSSHDLLQ